MAVKFCFEQHFSHGATIKFGSLDIGACFFLYSPEENFNIYQTFFRYLGFKIDD